MNCGTRQQGGRPSVFPGPLLPLYFGGPHDPDNGEDEDEDGRGDDPDDHSGGDHGESEEEESPLGIDEESDETEDRFPPWRHIPGFERDI